MLSDVGVGHMKTLSLDFPKKKRKKMPNIADMEAGILAAIESVVSGGSKCGVHFHFFHYEMFLSKRIYNVLYLN